MAALTVDESHGCTLVLGTSGYAPELVSLNWSGIITDHYETTHLATPEPTGGSTDIGGRTHRGRKLADPGTVEAVYHMNPDDDPPVNGAQEPITLTWPLGGGSTPASWAVTGSVEDFSIEVPESGGKMMCTCRWKLSGLITFTDEV